MHVMATAHHIQEKDASTAQYLICTLLFMQGAKGTIHVTVLYHNHHLNIVLPESLSNMNQSWPPQTQSTQYITLALSVQGIIGLLLLTSQHEAKAWT